VKTKAYFQLGSFNSRADTRSPNLDTGNPGTWLS